MRKRVRLFGTNGVRGVVNNDMTIDLACRLGYAAGTYLRPGDKVALGRDTRGSGKMLLNAFASGLLATGVDAVDLGILPTPALQYNVKGGYNFGIMITASHNPPEYNGIKCIAPDGTELNRCEEEKIEEVYFRERFREVEWDQVGSILHEDSAIEKYIDGIIARVDTGIIQKKTPTVVLDCGNGAASVVMPYLLERLSCKVITLNANPNVISPARESEPSESNLEILIALMRTGKADIGIAYDGDADRAVVVDEKGRYHMGDHTLTLVAKYITARKKGIVVTPVSSTMAVEDVVIKNGSRVVYTPVGAPIVARKMIDLNAVFGGEENGGLIFPEHQYCRDGGMTSAFLIELISSEGRISTLLDNLPRYFNAKSKFECPEGLKHRVMQEMTSLAGTKGRIDTLDGVKLWVDDGWVLVRPSGTEPIFRVFAESKQRKTAHHLVEEWTKIGKKLVRNLMP